MTKGLSIFTTLAALAALLLLGAAAPAAADWRADLEELVRAETGPRQDELLSEVLRAKPDWRKVVAALEALPFDDAETGTFETRQTVCADGVARPWILYVPPSYDPGTPTPLLVMLHGLVARPELMDDPLAYARDDEWAAAAEGYGWLVLYPFGQEGATWWDEVGMANIRNLVRAVKREYNVDDDRVCMGGFSDGASAAFCWAMVEPTDFSAFVALNGHMGVSSLAGDLDTYVPNFYNSPVYAVTTFDDKLYPAEKMRATIEMAQRVGVDVFYRELEGGHGFDYADAEIPLVTRWLARHPRDPFASTIVWEAATPEFGRCHWFQIDEIMREEAADWHTDYNAALMDDRITVGFIPADGEGPGVTIAKVIDDSPAAEMGLKEGHVIVGVGDRTVADMDDVDAWKDTVARGDDFTLRVTRGDDKISLKGHLPPPENYYVFKRARPSARANVTFGGNRVDVLASRLGAFTVYVHPDMFNLDEKVLIAVNDKVVFNAKVKPDVAFLLENFLEHRDRKALYVAAVEVEL
ncbi:MAG: PHB depolymerase family esterase [bacterium]